MTTTAETRAEAARRIEAISALGEIFRATLSETSITLYVAATSDLSREAFDRAVTRAVRELRFMPAAAELREFAMGATDDDGSEAWVRVDRAVTQIGINKSPDFSDETIHGAIRCMGGWVRLCSSTEDEWPFRRQEFLKHYKRLRLHGVPDELGGRLIGISEQTNRDNGFHELADKSIRKVPGITRTEILRGAYLADETNETGTKPR